ncbi:hypothetical protein D3C81_1910290 [compost metagenome]
MVIRPLRVQCRVSPVAPKLSPSPGICATTPVDGSRGARARPGMPAASAGLTIIGMLDSGMP